jgi:hypothetical protein
MNLRLASSALLLCHIVFTACSPQPPDWPEVASADFSKIQIDQFEDHELEVPYFLFHFHTVANAVLEEGEHRGFLDLKVNRSPNDNQPYNARIMEMQMALAYFYGSDRAWNPYAGDPALRVRLEAMLDRWTRIQNPNGLFAEYSPDNWSLAPTSFGAMAAAQTLEILIASGHRFDQAILDQARQTLRQALMAMFTRKDMRRHARNWSNQFSGSYYAAMIYLKLWPDAELNAAFTRAVADAVAHDQSPAGFHYEQSGPDFGYSSVHDNNLQVAFPHLRERPDLLALILDSDRRWNEWLGANFMPQPGLAQPTFLTNAGINTRTSHAVQHPRVRPLAELVQPARALAHTDQERGREIAAARENLARVWGQWGRLSVPNAYSYRPAFVYGAWRPLDHWQPTEEQRVEAVRAFPHLAATNFNRQMHDAIPLTVTTVRRPSYFAAFNSGRIRVPRQSYGLGLVWHDRFGTAMQTVSGTKWAWGTRPAGEDAQVYERGHTHAAIRVNGTAVEAIPGRADLPAGTVTAHYPLGETGEKTVTFHGESIHVSISHQGGFTELVPLVMPIGAEIEPLEDRIVVRRDDGSSFTLRSHTAGAMISIGDSEPFADGLIRRLATVQAHGSLNYELRFE